MAASHPESTQLTSDQRRQLGAVYQLILSWRRESNNQQASRDEQPVQASTPVHESKAIAAPPKSRGLT